MSALAALPDREWWSMTQIAEARLPGLPTSKNSLCALANREGWHGREGLVRPRRGRGGGWEYHRDLVMEHLKPRHGEALALLQAAWARAPREARLRFLEQALGETA